MALRLAESSAQKPVQNSAWNPAQVLPAAYLCAASSRVYVHCTAGLGRAPAVCIAYMYWFGARDLDGAYNHLTSVRPCGPKKDAIRGAQLMGLAGCRCFDLSAGCALQLTGYVRKKTAALMVESWVFRSSAAIRGRPCSVRAAQAVIRMLGNSIQPLRGSVQCPVSHVTN